jgi:UDP-N-acetylmuramate: L-alanyl-gamma-D-glutamyl-meso-diaminopimelate ligase
MAMPEEALLVACDDNPTVRDLVERAPCWTATYGFEEASPWRLENVRFDPPWTYFEVTMREEPFGTFRVPLMGRHNALNALAVIAVADDLRIPKDLISSALETFEGIRRRQEVRGTKRGITIIDDFAHHPTEVRETLAAAHAFYANSRLIAVFEPRTNSSMRKVFQKVYPKSFDDADLICIRKPSMLHKIPADERFSSEELTRDLKDRGKKAHYFPDTDAIIDYLVTVARPDDVILIMSNGGFDNIHERLLKRL